MKFKDSSSASTVILKHLIDGGYIDKLTFSSYPQDQMHISVHPLISNFLEEENRVTRAEVALENIRRLADLPKDDFYKACEVLELSVGQS